MKRAFQKHLDGMAATFAVCEQLCRYGHTPAIPVVDFGIDVMLDNGLKIQIKSSKCRAHPGYSNGVYAFDLRKGWTRVKGEIVGHPVDRDYAEICDFVVFFGVDERRFFVIPVGAIERHAIWIPRRGNAEFKRVKSIAKSMMQYEDAWHLLDVNGALAEIEQAAEEVSSNAIATEIPVRVIKWP